MRVKIDSSLASADGRYSAAVVARTGRGESFDERHEKTIHIGILRRGTEPPDYLFKKEYKFFVGNLDWRILWVDPEQVRIIFYDCPEDVSVRTDMNTDGKGKCSVFKTLGFMKNTISKEFLELPSRQ